MRLAVFLKYVLDPEILSRDFRIDPATGMPTTTFPNYQFDQYDCIALEIALKMREQHASDLEIASVCAGPEAAEDRLREALARKANEAILIETSDNRLSDHDRGRLLARWAGRQGNISIILCGRMTSDTDSSETGPVIAETLGWPLISNVVRIEKREGRVVCKREVGDGYEWRFVDLPFVATVTNAPDTNLRKARLQDVMRAHKLHIQRLAAQDFQDGSESQRGLKAIRTYVPNITRVCDYIDGDSAKEKAHALLARLLPLLDRKAIRAAAHATPLQSGAMKGGEA